MSGGHLDLTLLVGAAVVLAAVAGVRVSSRAGVPSLLLYLALGIVLGENVIGIGFDDPALARDAGLIALAVIVAEGGLTTHWPTIRPLVGTAGLLATVGVAVSIGVIAVTARYALDVEWRTAVIAGAVVSSTDAAAVFSTLRSLALPARLTGVLEAESGLNDAPVVIVVSLLSAGTVGSLSVAEHVAYQLAVGLAVGVVTGAAAVLGLRRAALPAAGLYPVATVAFAVTSYAAAASLKASGFLAVYCTALMMGNAALPHRRTTLGFVDGLAWLAQIGLFVMLGLLVTPSHLGGAILPGLAIAAVLLLVARPLSVVASTPGRAFGWRQRAFLSAAGLRGAVPVVLATIPLSEHVPGARRVFDVVFVVVASLTLLQSPLLAPMARRLGLVDRDPHRELDVESAPLDRMLADLITVRVGPESRLHGVEVWELRLPTPAAVAFVVRAGVGFVPESRTSLRHGDDLLVVTARAQRHDVEERLREVAAYGRMAPLPAAVSPTRKRPR
jgi:cell volume regulation protein A